MHFFGSKNQTDFFNKTIISQENGLNLKFESAILEEFRRKSPLYFVFCLKMENGFIRIIFFQPIRVEKTTDNGPPTTGLQIVLNLLNWKLGNK